MPSKIAAPSRVISRKVLLPDRFNVSRILVSPRENTEFVNFDNFSITPEVPKALRRTSGSLPGTRSETRPDPESSLRINPSFPNPKTTPFRSQDCHLGASNKPQPPAPVELLSLLHPLPSPLKDPTRRTPRVGGFRGPAATCADPGKKIATQRLLRSNLKIIEINGFRAFCSEK